MVPKKKPTKNKKQKKKTHTQVHTDSEDMCYDVHVEDMSFRFLTAIAKDLHVRIEYFLFVAFSSDHFKKENV
jgi:hypothetical protein